MYEGICGSATDIVRFLRFPKHAQEVEISMKTKQKSTIANKLVNCQVLNVLKCLDGPHNVES